MNKCETPQQAGARHLREAGYSRGGDVAGEKAVAKRVVRRALREHENAEHGGKHEALKLRHGGKVEGKKPEARPDRRARGGAMPEAKGKGKPAVAIKIATGGENPAKEQMAAQQGLHQGIQIGARLGARTAAQHMGAPGAGAMPPGAPMGAPGGMPAAGPSGAGPAGPQPPMKRGGAMCRADGGSLDEDEREERKPKGETDEPEAGSPGDEPSRKSGGYIKVLAHKRRVGGAV